MNSLVCIAYVPDTETKIKIGADGKSIDEADVKWIVSPYDEYALEEALKIKEAKGAGTVTVVSVGHERAKTGLRECLARGADEAIWIDSTGIASLDALGTAKALAAVAKGRRLRLHLVRPEGRGPGRVARRPDVRRACGRAARRQHHQARGRRREDHRAPGDRGRPRGRRVPAAGRSDRPEGPERAALRVAEGHHGGQEEDDRREEARGAFRPRGRSGAGEDPLAEARAAAARGRRSSSCPATIRRRPARSSCDCCGKKRRSSEP